ncbi:DUF1206 domain-containing protein [Serinicoccus sp. LYQ131]|uniref:DUF1206 domain-containing protein n=1 Tax=Serinicoccus sp. LYQ131 TaxID=3378797 RepID=UPI003854BD2B
MNDIVDEGARAARQATNHRWFERVARLGFAGSGLIHLLIGWIAARVALGGGGEADQGGALAAVREAPAGGVLLWVCVVGFATLAMFQLVEGVLGGPDLTDRLKAVGKGILYAALGVTTFTYARGGSSDSGESTTDLTATLLQAPLGRWLVAAVGIAVAAVGAYHVFKGLTHRFLEDLRSSGGGDLGRAIVVTGTLGYAAKGVALVVLGGLFGVAAWRADADEAAGLDAALKALAEQPFGTVLLLAVALGLILFGVYSVIRARYARM